MENLKRTKKTMTHIPHITRLILNQSRFGSRIMAMGLVGLGLIAMQSPPVQAQWTGNGNNINNTNTGNVGIGTTTPTAKLHIISADDTVAPALSIRQDTNPAYGFDFTLDTNVNGNLSLNRVNNGASANVLTFDRAGGNVGIGTTSPANRLEIVEANSATASSVRVLSGSSSAYAGYAIGRTGTEGYWGIAGAANHYANGAVAGDVILRSENNLILSNLTAPTMYLKSNGNVGIGTTNPGAKLDVAGGINASGTISGGNIVAKYQDVAEWVESSQELAAGTVVVLDQTKFNQVIASSVSYDTRVAGVISLQPGIVLGENGAGKVLVATTGRVRTKVDASRGAIQVGDLLVTSDVPGVAMKSQPIDVGDVQIHRPGTLIGKALEPLAKGSSEILVLLSLQ